jgi:hypothetical protein
VTDFSHHEIGGDAMLAKLPAIQMGLEFCRSKGYSNIVCESNGLDAVELFNAGRDNALHVHATDILHIKDVLHETSGIAQVHALWKQNICADFITKEG